MKRKIVIITISYIIGLIWGLYFNINIALILCLVLSTIFMKNKIILFASIILIISFIYNRNIKLKYDSFGIKQENLEIVGTIIEELDENDYLTKYIINVENIDNNNYKNIKLLVKMKKNKTNSKLKYGDKVEINGKLRIADVSRNYKGYNYNEYLRSKSVYGIVLVDSVGIKTVKKNNISKLKQFLWNIKVNIKDQIYKILPQNTANICVAILLGDKSNMEYKTINQFSESSLSHILAISGMHMVYIIMIFSFLLKKCGKNERNKLLIIIIILYCNLVENNESVVRATIMTILYILASLLHRKSDSLTNISISALIILVENPYSIKSLSFLLSFGGAIGIILFYKYIIDLLDTIISNNNKIVQYIKNSLAITFSVNIIIMPVLVLYFNKLSMIFVITSLLGNILITCIMPLIFTSIFISIFSIKIAKFISIILNLFLHLLLMIAENFSKNNIFNFIIVTPYTITVITYYIIVLAKIINYKIEKNKRIIVKKLLKLLICIYLSIILIINLISIIDFNMYIHFIDVGQGDCTLIISKNNQKILIDGGGSENGDDYVGENVLVPYLLDRRISVIDYIVISHFDSDHFLGCIAVLKKLKVKNVIIGKQFENSENYKALKKLIKDKNIKLHIVHAGQKINIEKDLYFDILWPDSQNVINENILNNNSLVCKLIYKDFNMLYTGDIEQIAEEAILRKYKNNLNILNAIVLKVAHHGSKTSSTKQFLEEIKPNIALIGVGATNTFGHPSNITIENLKEIECKIYRTDFYGEITIKTNGKLVKVDKFIKNKDLNL